MWELVAHPWGTLQFLLGPPPKPQLPTGLLSSTVITQVKAQRLTMCPRLACNTIICQTSIFTWHLLSKHTFLNETRKAFQNIYSSHFCHAVKKWWCNTKIANWSPEGWLEPLDMLCGVLSSFLKIALLSQNATYTSRLLVSPGSLRRSHLNCFDFSPLDVWRVLSNWHISHPSMWPVLDHELLGSWGIWVCLQCWAMGSLQKPIHKMIGCIFWENQTGWEGQD